MQARFCAQCGAALEPRPIDGRERACCPASGCGQVAWENPVPACAVVVRRPGQVLLCRRSIEPRRGAWGLPAGYMEVDESPETTAVREVREETGLLVQVTDLVDVLQTLDDPRKPSLLVVYEAREAGGELLPGDECDELGFFRFDELPEPLAFRNDRLILERLAKGVLARWPIPTPNP